MMMRHMQRDPRNQKEQAKPPAAQRTAGTSKSLSPAVAPHRYTAAEIAELRPWVLRTRQLVAQGLLRPPVGDLAEILIAWAVRGERAKLAAPGWDVVSGGRRIQVRGLWHAGHRSRGSIGAVPKICDSIVAVEFDSDLTVRAAWELVDLPAAGQRLQIKYLRTRGQPFPFDGADEELGLAALASCSAGSTGTHSHVRRHAGAECLRR
jgi:hypothetical protein